MKRSSPEKTLRLIEEALGHFYGITTEALLKNYQDYLDANARIGAAPAEREAAVAYFRTVPDRCAASEPFEMKPEMLSALTEEELQALCEELARSRPDLEAEIRSTFDFCLKVRRLL